jgi:hypothetical protein
MTSQQQLDGNYKPITGSVSLYDPVSASYVAQKAAVVATGTDGTPYAATSASLTITPPSIVQKTNNISTGSVASLSKAFSANNQAGNTIIVVAGCGNGTAMTVADSLGNTYTQVATSPSSTTFEVAIFSAVNIIGGSNTITVTNAGTAASMAMEIYEAFGLLTQVTGQPGQSSVGSATGTTASTSALAASVPNSLAFMGVAVGTTAEAITAVSGTPWTVDASLNTGATVAGLFSLGSLSLPMSGIGPVVPQATIAASKPWAAAAAIFKPAAIGVEGTVSIGGYNYTNITTATTTLVKTGVGTLHAIVINTGVASATIELDDALTHTTPKIGTITCQASTVGNPVTITYDLTFATGLSITTSGATDITVVWK